MVYAIMALVDPGDEVIVPDPGYPIYESITRFVGGTPVPIPIRMDNDFRLDVDELASLITPRTKLLVLNSPANPTGGVLTRDDIERIAELAIRPRPGRPERRDLRPDPVRRRGARRRSPSLPGMAERTIVLDGFSKTYAMTGWRLGYAIVPDWLVKAYRPADHQHDQRRDRVRAGRRDRGAARPAGRTSTRWSRSSGRGATSSSTASTRSRASAATGRRARSTSSRTSPGPGMTGAELAERLLPEAGVCVLAGHGVRRRRREPHPDLVRELPRESHRGARADPPVRGAAGRVRRCRPPHAPRRRERSRRSSSRGSSPTTGCASHRGRDGRRRSGRTSCRRRATSSSARSRAATAS